MGKINSFFEKHFVWLFYLYALASAVSITACTVILSLFLLFYLANPAENLRKTPRDFIFFLAVYAWKTATLLFNGLFSQLGRIVNVWDKLPYALVSGLKVDEKKIETFLKILFWANAAVIILALLQKYLDFPVIVKPLFTPDMERFKGYFSHPLRFAGYLSCVAVIAFSFSVFYSRKTWFFSLILLTGVFLTGSRSYFVSVILVVSLLALLRSKKFFLVFSAGLAVYLALLFAFLPSLSERVGSSFFPVSERVESSFSPKTSATSGASLRMNFWKAGWEIFLKNPVYGVGDREISGYLKPYKEAGLIDNISHAHSLYLNAAAENGIAGLVLVCSLLGYFIRKYFLEAKKSKDAFGRAFAFSILACFINLAAAGVFEQNFSTFIIWSFLTFYMGIFEAYRPSA